MDDPEIVELYLQRNENAIYQTALKYGMKLRKIANSILNSIESAEECENDTYHEAWNIIPPNEPRTYLFAFLGKIIRHFAIDECRKRAAVKRQALYCELTQEMEECIPGNSNVEAHVEASELGQTISSYLDSCTEDQRKIFVRRYWFFDTVSEISKMYGFSQSKVKTTLFRVREGLREHLEKEGYAI